MPDYTLVLKTFANYRKMTADDEALVALLRGMNESQREMLREALGPPAKAKSARPATKKFKKCDVCGVSKRAAHHRDVDHPDYHEFDEGGPAEGAVKRRGLPTTVAPANGKPPAPLLCSYEIDGKVCHGEENDGIHDKSLGYSGYHPFALSPTARNAHVQSSTSGSEASSKTDSEDVSSAAGG